MTRGASLKERSASPSNSGQGHGLGSFGINWESRSRGTVLENLKGSWENSMRPDQLSGTARCSLRQAKFSPGAQKALTR